MDENQTIDKEVLASAINYLARRDYGRQELSFKLQQKGFINTDIDKVLDYVEQRGYQSDIRFAEITLKKRLRKGYGWQFIAQELAYKGINSEIITNLRENHQIDWYLQAELAYNKRFGDSEIKDQKDKARRIRFLQQRGFLSEHIFQVAALK